MINTLYLIRHAESVANTKGIYQGQSYDTPLSILGYKQANALGLCLKDKEIDKLFISPLTRTRETAGVIASLHTSPLQVEIAPELIETNHGQWEGKSKTDIASSSPALYRLWQTNPGEVSFPGGESFRNTAKRAAEWFDWARTLNGNFAAVTHANIIQAILAHVENVPLAQIWQYSVEPAAITVIETHGWARVVVINDTRHLAGLISNLSTQAL